MCDHEKARTCCSAECDPIWWLLIKMQNKRATIMRYRTCEHYFSRFRTVSDTRTKAGASETRRFTVISWHEIWDITAWRKIATKLSNKCCIVIFWLESVLFFVDTDLTCDSVIDMRLICCNLLHLHLRTFHICRSALSLSTFACASISFFGSFNHLLPCHDSSLRIL